MRSQPWGATAGPGDKTKRKGRVPLFCGEGHFHREGCKGQVGALWREKEDRFPVSGMGRKS